MTVKLPGLCALALLSVAEFALAVPFGVKPAGTRTANCNEGGSVVERAPQRARFDLFLTDDLGQRINGVFATGVGKKVVFPIPAGRLRLADGSLHNVCDVSNVTTILGNTGEVADLSLESLFLDPSNEVQIGGVFATLEEELGRGIPLLIPDLYADTNGNGSLGDGDVLYSLIDIRQYLDAVPLFSFGDMFSITNGETLLLPGMLFSTTPFLYNPTSATGFDFTPFNGDAVAASLHELSVPEPATLMLFGIGFLGALVSGGGRGRQRTSAGGRTGRVSRAS